MGELVREIVAEEIRDIDDERLENVAITAVEVSSDLERAVVFYDSFVGETGDEIVLGALSELRVRLQAAVGRQMRARRTPVLEFRPDDVIRQAERVDRLLREQSPPRGEGGGD